MTSPSSPLLPLDQVTQKLHLITRTYLGVRSIPLDRIVGSVDRASEFDRRFRPRRRASVARLAALRAAYPDGGAPPIAVFEVGGSFFVSDGHHRVALAHEQGQEFIEADVVRLETSYELPPDVDVPQLVHTEVRRVFLEQSGLADVRPDVDIVFSTLAGYYELLEIIKAHGWDLALRDRRLPSRAEVATDWLSSVYEPSRAALGRANLRPYHGATAADVFLWFHQQRRSLCASGSAWDIDAAAWTVTKRRTVPWVTLRSLLRPTRSPLRPHRTATKGPDLAEAAASAPRTTARGDAAQAAGRVLLGGR